MAKGETLFSKVFRGFSPDEVTVYIDELNAAFRNAKVENEAKINALNEELMAAKHFKDEVEGLKKELEQKELVICKQNEQIERLNIDTENQRLAIATQNEKVMSLEENIHNLKSELEAAEIKNAAMVQNSKEYESMLADVDSILASSRRKAEELIAEAEKKAAEIISNAEAAAKAKSEQIISESDEHLNDNLKKVKYLRRRQDEIAEIFKEHKAKVDSFFASLSDTSDKE